MPTITGFTSGVLADVYHQLLACQGRVLIYYFVVQSFTRVWHFATQWTAASQASLSFTVSWSLLKSCPLSHWCHPTISSSVSAFCSSPQSFPASEFFPVSRLPIKYLTTVMYYLLSSWGIFSFCQLKPCDSLPCSPKKRTRLTYCQMNKYKQVKAKAWLMWPEKIQ